jgi:hypothetical protein
MRFAFVLLPCLFMSVPLRAQTPPCSGCPNEAAGHLPHSNDVCLSDKELVTHIATRIPIGPPGLNEPHMNIQGTVMTCLCFSRRGKVTDIHILSGPTMMQQPVLESLKDWTFHPVKQGRRLYGGCGILRIHVDMIDSQVSTTIEK